MKPLKESGGDDVDQRMAEHRARLALFGEMPSVFVNAAKGQATGVFGAFVGVALGVGVAVPTLTTIAIAVLLDMRLVKVFEYLFFSDTASPGDPAIVVGKTALTEEER